MTNGAFPFRAARPKGAPKPEPPKMSFDLPAAPPSEVQFENSVGETITITENFKPELTEEEVAKRKRQAKPRTAKTVPIKTNDPKKKFTFAEVVEVLGEDVPFVKVIARIAPVIEVLPTADRKRVVDILVRLYG